MKKLIAIVLFFFTVSSYASEPESYRDYLLIGEISPAGLKYLTSKPVDSADLVNTPLVKKALEAIGGELISYHFAVGTNKNYIRVRIPNDKKTVHAMYTMRMATGLLISYQFIELMDVETHAKSIKTTQQFIELEDNLGGLGSGIKK